MVVPMSWPLELFSTFGFLSLHLLVLGHIYIILRKHSFVLILLGFLNIRNVIFYKSFRHVLR